ncbi:hypothetical protein EIO60_01170|nr:hypothetical protein [Candidatus Pantoea persica]
MDALQAEIGKVLTRAAICKSVRGFIIFLLFIVTLMLTSSPLFSVKTL